MSGDRTRIVIIGVGNVDRGDDGAGVAVARKIVELQGTGIDVLQESGEGTSLIEAWKGAKCVILVDAIQSGAAPGTIRRIDAGGEPIPAGSFRGSTHGFGVADAIELARTLGELPAGLVVFGIEGQDFTPGGKLSPAVRRAVTIAAAQILREAQRLSPSHDPAWAEAQAVADDRQLPTAA
jgi:hydrogenase maturation protease